MDDMSAFKAAPVGKRCSARAGRVLSVVWALAVLNGVPPAHAQQAQKDREETAGDELQSHRLEPEHFHADVIVAWNSLAHDIAFAEDQFLTFKGQRALAIMHLAMHDALNTIAPIYDTYGYAGRRHNAHPIAATAQAAHDVLVALYPTQQAPVAEELQRWLTEVPDGALRDRGLALGRATAAALLAQRNGDGWNAPGTYEFGEGPGRYQTTPPWNGFVAHPGFRFAKPFVLTSPHQFRPAPAPRLGTKAYARAVREVQEYGAAASTVRTTEQTAYAIWWMEFAEGSINRLARQLAAERQLPLWPAARMFAQVGVALFDTYVGTWDAKYEYDHWRPYTAIRSADSDGNPRTIPDLAWEPLRPTPPFPEYSSAHAAACAASLGVLARTFGQHVSFTMETTTAPPGMPTRTFDSFEHAAEECADSRVRLGWHFRYATDAGLSLGRHIARYTFNRALRPRRGHHGDK